MVINITITTTITITITITTANITTNTIIIIREVVGVMGGVRGLIIRQGCALACRQPAMLKSVKVLVFNTESKCWCLTQS